MNYRQLPSRTYPLVLNTHVTSHLCANIVYTFPMECSPSILKACKPLVQSFLETPKALIWLQATLELYPPIIPWIVFWENTEWIHVAMYTDIHTIPCIHCTNTCSEYTRLNFQKHSGVPKKHAFIIVYTEVPNYYYSPHPPLIRQYYCHFCPPVGASLHEGSLGSSSTTTRTRARVGKLKGLSPCELSLSICVV